MGRLLEVHKAITKAYAECQKGERRVIFPNRGRRLHECPGVAERMRTAVFPDDRIRIALRR